jgi:hypothetical protein
MAIQIRAYDALNYQKGPVEPGTISRRVQFQMEPDVGHRDLGNFLSGLNLRRISWKHQGNGLYHFLLPREQSACAFESRVRQECEHLGHLVPFKPQALESQSLNDESKKFPSTECRSPDLSSYWRFRVNSVYNSSELMDLLDVCEARGAWFKHLGGGLYEIRVPDTIDKLPFSQTIDDCPSVTNLEAS